MRAIHHSALHGSPTDRTTLSLGPVGRRGKRSRKAHTGQALGPPPEPDPGGHRQRLPSPSPPSLPCPQWWLTESARCLITAGPGELRRGAAINGKRAVGDALTVEARQGLAFP